MSKTNLNRLFLLGNIGEKPALKETTGETSVCELSLGVSRGKGETQKTDWFSVTIFDKTAENAVEYLDKGSKVLVEAELKQDTWEKDGKKQSRVTIRVLNVTYLPNSGASYAKVLLTGNLSRDPELKYTPNGTAVTTFSVAVNGLEGKKGEKREFVSFIDLKAFKEVAEAVGNNLEKGSLVLVEGRLVKETWKDKDTEDNRSKLVVNASTVKFLTKKKGAEESAEDGSSMNSNDLPDPEFNNEPPF